MKKILATLGIAAFATTAAFAETPAFSAADLNADGVVSMEEAKTALPQVEESKIVAADANNDGALSEEEYVTLTTS